MSESITTVAEIKRYLRQTQSADDALLQELINNAEDEALQFLDLTALPVIDSDGAESSDMTPLGRSFRAAVCVLLQMQYEEPDAGKWAMYRQRAEALLMPYRQQLGI